MAHDALCGRRYDWPLVMHEVCLGAVDMLMKGSVWVDFTPQNMETRICPSDIISSCASR